MNPGKTKQWYVQRAWRIVGEFYHPKLDVWTIGKYEILDNKHSFYLEEKMTGEKHYFPHPQAAKAKGWVRFYKSKGNP